ncbi:MAG: penicillin acylase family protein [Chitinophagales bacterium]|nr:penicillin acylase family protein [Chitinophagales bacterium]
MKKIGAAVSAIITLVLIVSFNSKLGPLPALGKLLNPNYGIWQNVETSENFKDASIQLKGLKGKVSVLYDERLVPHIRAENDEDLYFMQGFVTAKHRLWQMEIATHAAAGRVSEIIGEKGLESDRTMRRIGMVFGAENSEDFIAKDEESKRLITAYCNGVNAYIQSLSKKELPIEYKLLGYEPEAWKPKKVALLLKNMANMLSVYEYDIQNTAFVEKFGKDEFQKLYPDFIENEDPIISDEAIEQSIGGSIKQASAPSAKTRPLESDVLPPSNRKLHSGKASFAEPSFSYPATTIQDENAMASNNWAVHGSKTATGKPILCNDPHLKLSLPSIWYEMHLSSPTTNVYGATLPGAPAVIIGCNDSIAWGVTNGGRDVRDWYKIEFNNNSRTAYKLDGAWQPTTFKIETFKVNGQPDFIDTIVFTKFGPVVYDRNFGDAPIKQNLAMKWTAHLASNEFKTFYLMNRGKNYDDYRAALQYFTCPSQNFVFASAAGDIAITQQGKFPVRDRASEQGKYISTAESKNDWTSFIPNEKNPTEKNPARGFVSSANQHPTTAAYEYYYPGVGVYENYRNRVINNLLRSMSHVTADDMKKMQNNNYFLLPAEAQPVLIGLLDTTQLNSEEKKVLAVLQQWNFYAEPNALAPVYFEIWWNELRRMLFDEMLDPKTALKQPTFYTIVDMLKKDSTSIFYDIAATPEKETRTDIVLQSFKVIAESLRKNEFVEVHEPYGTDVPHKLASTQNLDWGKYKATKIEHLAKLDAFSSLNVYNGGNLGVINATNSTNGPSWRMVIDFGEKKAYTVYPGGQSGNPASKFYDNMVNTWAKGEHYLAAFFNEEPRKLFQETYYP